MTTFTIYTLVLATLPGVYAPRQTNISFTALPACIEVMLILNKTHPDTACQREDYAFDGEGKLRKVQ